MLSSRPPGARPAPLPAEAVPLVRPEVPLRPGPVEPPSLEMPTSTLRFLTAPALAARRKEEEAEEQRKVKAEEWVERRLRQTIKMEFLELCDLGTHRSSLQTRRMWELAENLDSTEHPSGIAASAGKKRKRKKKRRKSTSCSRRRF